MPCLKKKKKSRLIEKFGFGFNFSPRSKMCDPVNGGRMSSAKELVRDLRGLQG